MVDGGKLRFSILSLVILFGVLGFVNAATLNVGPGDSIQDIIDSSNESDIINFSNGNYEITETIMINKPLTLTCSGNSKIEGISLDALQIFNIQSSDVIIQNFEISTILNTSLASEIEDALIGISGSDLTGILIKNNKIYVPAQSGAMSTWVARAITVDSNSVDEIAIEENTIYNTRNGIVIRYGNTAQIKNNIIFNTKGGVMDYTSNQADADNRLIENNSWNSIVDGIISHNEWDIVWNTAYYVPDYQESVIDLSLENNGAYVVDRRAANADSCANINSNRNVVFVDSSNSNAQTILKPTNGDFNEPFSSISLALNAVISGGIIYVSEGSYAESLILTKTVNLIGEDKETTILNGRTTVNSDNVTIKNLNIQPGNSGTSSSDDFALKIYKSNVLVENSIIDGMIGSAVTIKAVHIFADSSTPIKNISLQNNIIRNINQNAAKGSYGIIVQAAIEDVAIKDNLLQNINSNGWAHAIEVTPTCGTTSLVPKNVVIEGNSISSVSAPSDVVSFSIDWCESKSRFADASQIIFENNLVNNIQVRNLDDSHYLSAQNNYWGTNPNFANLISGNIVYAPWFSDEGMTDLTMGQVIEKDDTTNITTSTIENEINLTTENIIVSLPAGISITSEDTSWDGTILPPTIKENATVAPNTTGLVETVSKVVEVGFVGVKLILSKAVKIVILGETGKKVGYSYDGTFHKITNECNSATDYSNIVGDGECYYDDGTNMIIWTKHFTQFVTYNATDNETAILNDYWNFPIFPRPMDAITIFTNFTDPSGISSAMIRYSYHYVTGLKAGQDEEIGNVYLNMTDTGDNIVWANNLTFVPTLSNDGYFKIRFSAIDGSGNLGYYPSVDAWQMFTSVDGTPANTALSFNGSHSGNYVRNDTQIILNSTDLDFDGAGDYQPSGVNYSSYKINNGNWNLFGGYTSFTISGNDGNYTVRYFSVDNATNAEDEKSTTLTLDNTKPEVSMSYPENKTYDSQINQINYSASDDGSGLSYCWYDNGTTSAPEVCGTSFTLSNSNEGLNHWTIYSNDSVGNLNFAEIYFTQDTITPEINYNPNTPANNSYLNINSVLVNVSITETNIESVILNWNSIDEVIIENDGSGNYWITKSNLSDGSYGFYVTVNDSVGHFNLTETRMVTVDKTAPEINFLNSTTNSGNYSQNYITANISASDDGSELNNTRIYLYHLGSLINSSTESEINFTGLDDGTYYLNATAEDNAGNIGFTETRMILLDTTAPFVEIMSPSDNSNLTSDRTIYVNATDLNGIANVEFKLVNSSNSSQVYKQGSLSYNSASKLYEGAITNVLADVPVGSYSLQVTAEDRVGNENVSTITLNAVEYVLPSITSVVSSVPFGQNSTVQFNISFAIRNGNAVRMKMSDLSNGVDSYTPLELNARLVYNGTEYPVRNAYTGDKLILPSTIAGSSGVAVFKMDIPSSMNPGNYNANYQFEITQE